MSPYTTAMKLRNSAKGVIVRDGRVLLTRCVDGTGEWFCFPGGGQLPVETLADAVRRECHEETGAVVSVGEMLGVLEWYDEPNATHAIEFYFFCALEPGCEVGQGVTPDSAQVGVEWVPHTEVDAIDLRPHELKPLIRKLSEFRYLGLVGGIRVKGA